MKILFNADDFGMSRSVNDDILETVDRGPINGVSIVTNGYDFEYAARELRKRPGLRAAVHLNLVEAQALSPREEVPDLVDERGYLNNNFGTLLSKYLLMSPTKRLNFKDQIKAEFRRQIQRYLEFSNHRGPLELDSHQHTHLLPFVGDAVVELCDEFDVAYVRVISEPLVNALNVKSLKHRFGINLIKLVLLNLFTVGLKRKLEAEKVSYCKFFFGVGFSGTMSIPLSKEWLSSIGANDGDACEVLFHPGGVHDEINAKHWQGFPGFLSFYVDSGRQNEKQSLLSEGSGRYLDAS